LSGIIGFSAAIGIHPIVGYTDFTHLAPAVLGASIFIIGLILCFKPMYGGIEQAAYTEVSKALDRNAAI
jgi:dihydroorotate dehydrogenase